MRLSKKKPRGESIWTRDLVPPDSIWGKELIPEDSFLRRELIPEGHILRKDLFAGFKKSRCLECPILMLAEKHRCNRYTEIPADIWDGVEVCPLYEERKLG